MPVMEGTSPSCFPELDGLHNAAAVHGKHGVAAGVVLENAAGSDCMQEACTDENIQDQRPFNPFLGDGRSHEDGQVLEPRIERREGQDTWTAAAAAASWVEGVQEPEEAHETTAELVTAPSGSLEESEEGLRGVQDREPDKNPSKPSPTLRPVPPTSSETCIPCSFAQGQLEVGGAALSPIPGHEYGELGRQDGGRTVCVPVTTNAAGNLETCTGEEASLHSLAAQVKEFQRTSKAAARSWRLHCDELGGGIFNPTRHTQTFLKQWLEKIKIESVATGAHYGTRPIDKAKSGEQPYLKTPGDIDKSLFNISQRASAILKAKNPRMHCDFMPLQTMLAEFCAVVPFDSELHVALSGLQDHLQQV